MAQRRRGILTTVGNALEMTDIIIDLGVVNLRTELALQVKDLVKDLIAEGFTKAQAEAIVPGKA